MEYFYKPKKRVGEYAALCLLTLILSLGCAALGVIFKKAFLYVASFALLCLSFQIFTVFILTSYEYGVTDGLFVIYKVMGNNRQRIFDLDLNFAEAPVPYKDAKKEAKKSGAKYRYFYCTSGNPRKKCKALKYDSGKPCILCFYADDALCSIICTHTGSRPEAL